MKFIRIPLNLRKLRDPSRRIARSWKLGRSAHFRGGGSMVRGWLVGGSWGGSMVRGWLVGGSMGFWWARSAGSPPKKKESDPDRSFWSNLCFLKKKWFSLVFKCFLLFFKRFVWFWLKHVFFIELFKKMSKMLSRIVRPTHMYKYTQYIHIYMHPP